MVVGWRAEFCAIISLRSNTAGGGRLSTPSNYFEQIDGTCVLDCNYSTAKLLACGVWGGDTRAARVGQPDRQAGRTGLPAPQLLSLGHCPNFRGHRPSGAMGAEEEVLVTLSGGAPWGFRLQGGAEQRKPLQVSKVRESL